MIFLSSVYLEIVFRISCSITFPQTEMKLTACGSVCSPSADGRDAFLKTSGSSLNCHDYSINVSALMTILASSLWLMSASHHGLWISVSSVCLGIPWHDQSSLPQTFHQSLGPGIPEVCLTNKY